MNPGPKVHKVHNCKIERRTSFHVFFQRETTGVLASVMGYSSTVATYAAGVFLPWRELATMLMFLGVPYALGILFYVPETPRFLLNCGHQKAAQR